MIKAIIFDCFGVLVTDGWLPFKHQKFAHDPRLDLEASAMNDLANKGTIRYAQFISQIAELAGMPALEAESMINQNSPNEILLEFIKSLKDQYKIGMLSNAAENWLDELFSPEQLKLFDAVVLSCDVGTVKPRGIIYRVMAQRLGLTTQECVFVDDLKPYVVGAEDVGMQGVLYQDTVDCIRQINAIIAD